MSDRGDDSVQGRAKNSFSSIVLLTLVQSSHLPRVCQAWEVENPRTVPRAQHEVFCTRVRVLVQLITRVVDRARDRDWGRDRDQVWQGEYK